MGMVLATSAHSVADIQYEGNLPSTQHSSSPSQQCPILGVQKHTYREVILFKATKGHSISTFTQEFCP